MPGTCSQGGLGQGENSGQGCVCETRLSVQTQPVTENTASTVGAGNNARKQMASRQLFSNTHKRHKSLHENKKNACKRIRFGWRVSISDRKWRKAAGVASCCGDVSVEKESGRFKHREVGGGVEADLGFGLADGASLTEEGSGAQWRYEENGKECRQRRNHMRWAGRVTESQRASMQATVGDWHAQVRQRHRPRIYDVTLIRFW